MTTYAKSRISNPARYFHAPDDVLADKKLNFQEKEDVLKSMAVDSEQMLDATAEGMTGTKAAYKAKDLQAALNTLKDIEGDASKKRRVAGTNQFRKIVAVTTVNQDLNREVSIAAYDLAELSGGQVCLLNVVPAAVEGAGLATAAPMATAIPPLAVDQAEIIEERRKQLLELRSESGLSSDTEIEVRSGFVEETIIACVDEQNADIIVVGSPNRSWLEALFKPSTARSITRAATCPVLVVPEEV